jgi:multiple antibiotic resistance protein
VLTSLPGAIGVTVGALFPIMNPIGALPAFAGLTEGDEPAHRRSQGRRAAIYSGALLVVFAIAGRPILHGLGIGLPALQVAGGLIVGHSAYGMVVNGPRLTDHEQAHGQAKDDISFTPLAMPLLAGPGAIGIVIGLAGRSDGTAPIAGIVVGCLLMALLIAVVFRLGAPLLEHLGETGIGAMSRIFGFLILAIAVELIAHGILALAPGLRH